MAQKSANANEVESWRLAALTMMIITGIVFIVQQFFIRLFDQVFVICVFYLPTFLLVIVFLWFRRASERSQA